jgi:hypothetical protein
VITAIFVYWGIGAGVWWGSRQIIASLYPPELTVSEQAGAYLFKMASSCFVWPYDLFVTYQYNKQLHEADSHHCEFCNAEEDE